MTRVNDRFPETLARVRERLRAARGVHGHWEGELSSSALSTATAVLALAKVDRARHGALIRGGLDWLAAHANADGGWGDTVQSPSNLSTTTLAWSAFGLLNEAAPAADTWLQREIPRFLNPEPRPVRRSLAAPATTLPRMGEGGTLNPPPSGPDALARALLARYGKDRTFSVPILTACALAGRLGEGPDAWRRVLPLPFELALLPAALFKWLRLPVVSYALPALIAIGQARHHFRPPRNPLVRILRDRARAGTLRVLERIQPDSGGLLEAAPLTSFVAMALAGIGVPQHPVAVRAAKFLTDTVRPDGSWPIDVDLATWITTLSVNALTAGDANSDDAHRRSRGSSGCTAPAVLPGRLPGTAGAVHPLGSRGATNCAPYVFDDAERDQLCAWLLGQQYRAVHPFTQAAPGGWAWTDRSGGVPDADDTAGALLALAHLSSGAARSTARVAAAGGVRWLVDLQNSDGGIPTFCRGWGTLPFDRSTPDLTAHALRAFAAWRDELPAGLQARVCRASRRAVRFLARTQRPDGAWSPLWFGNQHAPGGENLTYGTTQVLLGLQAWAASSPSSRPGADEAAPSNEAGDRTPASLFWRVALRRDRRECGAKEVELRRSRGVAWLLSAQNPGGSWGGGVQTGPSIEETALAVSALASVEEARAAVERGVDWLIAATDAGRKTPAAPIGLYFAQLWYDEKLYPLIHLAGALERVARRQRATTE